MVSCTNNSFIGADFNLRVFPGKFFYWSVTGLVKFFTFAFTLLGESRLTVGFWTVALWPACCS